MNPEQAWLSALGQLQLEMPRATFDTWVKDTAFVSFDAGVFTVRAPGEAAREWLESRLTSTLEHLLLGITNQEAALRFIVLDEAAAQAPGSKGQGGGAARAQPAASEPQPLEELERLQALARTAYAVRYDKVVNPYKRIIVDGYLARHVPEIGARLALLYIGCHQGAWMDGARQGAWLVRLPIPRISRYTGLSETATKRLLYNPATWEALEGLVERPAQEKKWKAHADGRLHRAPIGYAVHMTLPLSWADALALVEWLAERQARGETLLEALVAALQVKELVGEILLPLGMQAPLEEARGRLGQLLPGGSRRPLYVVDIAMALSGAQTEAELPEELRRVADALHTRIVKAFGTLGITHYFVETVIPGAHLSPDLAMLIILLRARCYVNEKTAEVRNEVLVRGGYAEMAAWLGLKRVRTIWEWVTGRVDQKTLKSGASWEAPEFARRSSVKGLGPGPAFLQELEPRAEDASTWKRFNVRLLEPLFDDGSGPISNDGSGLINRDGNGPIKHDGSGQNKADGSGLISADGSDPIKHDGSGPEVWRKWTGINDSMTLVLSLRSVQEAISSTTRSEKGKKAGQASWELKPLLVRSGAYAPSIRSLLTSQVQGEQFVAWLLYGLATGQGGAASPMKAIMKTLLEAPSAWPGEAYDRLARMPPRVLIGLVDLALRSEGGETGNRDWDSRMGAVPHARLRELRGMLSSD